MHYLFPTSSVLVRRISRPYNHGTHFSSGDIIEVKAVPKAGGNIIYKTLEVMYSPITARENLVRLQFLLLLPPPPH